MLCRIIGMTLVRLWKIPVDLIETFASSRVPNKRFLIPISDVSLQITIPVGTPTDPSATNHLITTSTS